MLVKKEEISELDKARRAYFNEIAAKFKHAKALFSQRDHQKCFDEMEAIIKMAMHAYDLETLLALFSLRSQISLFFGSFELAVKDLRKLNQVADEIELKS